VQKTAGAKAVNNFQKLLSRAPDLTSEEEETISRGQICGGSLTAFSSAEVLRMVMYRRAVSAGHYTDAIDGVSTTDWMFNLDRKPVAGWQADPLYQWLHP